MNRPYAVFVSPTGGELEQGLNLAQWLDYLEQCHPSTIELGLERISRVASRLPIEFSGTRIITVGGTNGKGSTVAMLAAILEEGGYSVGCYTSPHILHYNERVRLGSRLATDEELCASFEAVEKVRGDVQLTYFEFGTLAALQLFSRFNPDFIILEVGLGGRLDAVNILDPDLSILTNVAMDHMDWLGDNRDAIGFEKAGIFRPGTPALIGEDDIPASVLEYAGKIDAVLYRNGREFSHSAGKEGHWQWSGTTEKGEALAYRELSINDFPLDNCAMVIQAITLLTPEITLAQISAGLSRAVLTGRFQQVDKGYPLVLDVAHNPHAAARVAEQIKSRFPGYRVHILLAMLSDKDHAGVIEIYRALSPVWYVADIEEVRGLKGKILYNYLLELGENDVHCFSAIAEAFRAADGAIESHMKSYIPGAQGSGEGRRDVLLVTGSFFTVSAVLELI